jgi:hypothetical protein
MVVSLPEALVGWPKPLVGGLLRLGKIFENCGHSQQSRRQRGLGLAQAPVCFTKLFLRLEELLYFDLELCLVLDDELHRLLQFFRRHLVVLISIARPPLRFERDHG